MAAMDTSGVLDLFAAPGAPAAPPAPAPGAGAAAAAAAAGGGGGGGLAALMAEVGELQGGEAQYEGLSAAAFLGKLRR